MPYDKEKRKAASARYYQNNKEKCNARRRKRAQESREYVQGLKKTGKCVDCGEDRWPCLDFDHVDTSQKKYDIKYLTHSGMSIATIQKELDKCVLRCSNCHRWRHHLEREDDS